MIFQVKTFLQGAFMWNRAMALFFVGLLWMVVVANSQGLGRDSGVFDGRAVGAELAEAIDDLVEEVGAVDVELAEVLAELLFEPATVDQAVLEELAGLVEVLDLIDGALAQELKSVVSALEAGIDGADRPDPSNHLALDILLGELAPLDEELAFLLEEILVSRDEIDLEDFGLAQELIAEVEPLDGRLAERLRRFLSSLAVFEDEEVIEEGEGRLLAVDTGSDFGVLLAVLEVLGETDLIEALRANLSIAELGLLNAGEADDGDINVAGLVLLARGYALLESFDAETIVGLLEDFEAGNLPVGDADRRFARWLASDLVADFNGNGRPDRDDFRVFLEDFAEDNGLLRFEGLLEGIDLAERLLVIDGDFFEPAANLRIEDNQGRQIGLTRLREILGRALKVAVLINDDDEVLQLVILSRIDDILPEEPVPLTREIFGEVARFDGDLIILRGPFFAVGPRTRVVDADNREIRIGQLEVGQLLSVTPGAPEPGLDSDSVALRVQVANRRNPPATGTGHVVGVLVKGVAGDDAGLQLAGLVAAVEDETIFVDTDGNALRRGAVEPGIFVRLEVCEPGFGEENLVAVAVVVLDGPDGGVQPPDGASVEEIQLEGFVLDLDTDKRYLVLEGLRVRLGEAVKVFDFDGLPAQPAGLFPGDLLEIDTQPDGQGGFSATRLRVIDPALQVFERPGVLSGAFETIDGDELILAGLFLQVPEDADIRGRGGVAVGLSEIGQGDYVRVAAAAPRSSLGENLPVALKIRVVEAPQPEPVPGDFGKKQRFVGSFPEDGDVQVALKTEIEITFSRPVFELVRQPGFRFEIFPEPPFVGRLELSPDGRTLAAEVELEEDQVYQLAVIAPSTGLLEIGFTTGAELASGAIAGRITAPRELPENVQFSPEESFVLLVETEGIEELFDAGFAAEEKIFDLIEGNIVAGIPLDGRQFRFSNVPEGGYFVVAFVGFDLGRGDFIELQAFLDADDDGEPDVVEIGREEVEVELVLQLPARLEIVELTPQPRSTGVDQEAEITISFNQPAYLDQEDILVFPEPLEVLGFGANDDLTQYTLLVELEDDTIYRVAVEFAEDKDGGELVEGSRTSFTTGEEFGDTHTVSGRLVLPHLPAARRFDGPALVGLVPFNRIDRDEFGFDSFDQEDIVAFTSTRRPEYVIEDVRPGVYAAVAYVLVDVPRGFRPPDPLERALERFEISQGRFAAQVLKVFDTIELFGFHSADDVQRPARVIEDMENVNILLRANARSRRDLLRVERAGFPGVALSGTGNVDDLPLIQAGEDEIAVRFNKKILAGRGFVAVEAALNGRPLRSTGVSNDGQSVFFSVSLDQGQFYRFSVFEAEAADGSELDQPFDAGFRTGEVDLDFGAIAGRVRLETVDTDGNVLVGEDADQIDAAKVLLYEAQSDENGRPVLVGVARIGTGGAYRIGEVEPGEYRIGAEIQASSGQEVRGVHGDVLRVGTGQVLEGIGITARVVVEVGGGETPVKTAPSGGNDTAVLSVDLDPSDGDQGLSSLSGVEVGQQVSVDVYIDGASDLSGVALKLRYDADILRFVDAADGVAGRTNFLRQEGALVVWLFPLLREPVLEYGGAILGATAATAPDGGGFLARFRFEISAQFEGAQIIIEEAILKSIGGEDILQPLLSAKLAPPVFAAQVKGPISIDLDNQAGDQELFHKGFIGAGDQVVADFYINFDKIGDGSFKDLSNYSLTVEFDPDQLDYVSYAPATSQEANVLIAGGGNVPVLPAITTDGKVSFGNAILGPIAATAPDTSGFIGQLTFTAKAGFSRTDLLVTSYAYKSVDAPQQETTALVLARLSDAEIEFSTPVSSGSGAVTAAKVDFDGSGAVDFGDFFAFADLFGQPATGAAAAFDLDGSGTVDFGDFFSLADLFGQSVGKVVPRAYGLAPVDGSLALQALSRGQGLEVQIVATGIETGGFRAVVEYDPAAFRLEEADAAGLAAGDNPALLIRRDGDGQVLLVGASTSGLASGTLANLRFAPLTPEAVGLFRLVEGQVRGELDLLQPVLGAAIEGRWIPQTFALRPNFPNPFNPSTTIGFGLPHSAEVRLELYDVLGQKVRTLVKALLPAGAHQAVWDGRDQVGRTVAGGMYFYRLEAGNFSQVRKLMLLK
jgi:hypothetical protein